MVIILDTSCFLLPLPFQHKQSLLCYLDQLAEPVAVFGHVHVDVEPGFGAGIGVAFLVVGANEILAGFGDFDEELVVADEGDDFVIAIECVLTKHLARPNMRDTDELVEEVFDS